MRLHELPLQLVVLHQSYRRIFKQNGRNETGKRKPRIVKYCGILPTFNKGTSLIYSYFIYQVDLREPVLIVVNVLLYAVPIVSVTEYLKFCKIYSVNVLWRT